MAIIVKKEIKKLEKMQELYDKQVGENKKVIDDIKQKLNDARVEIIKQQAIVDYLKGNEVK